MSTKNIVLIVVCAVCLFFIVKKFNLFGGNSNKSYDLETTRCDLVADWLKKKNIDETALFGFSDTLTTRLEKNGIKVNSTVTNSPSVSANPMNPANPSQPMNPMMSNPTMPNPDLIISEFFTKVKSAKIKCIVFVDGYQPKASTVELLAFLKSGGHVYFKSYPDDLNDDETLHQAILEAMKKGLLMVVKEKAPETNTSSFSNKNRILAENYFFDDTNSADFDTWHKNYVKTKASFARPPSHP